MSQGPLHIQWGVRGNKSLTSSLSVSFTFSEISLAIQGHMTARLNPSWSNPYVDIKFMLGQLSAGNPPERGVRGFKTNWNKCRCYVDSSNQVTRVEVMGRT